MTEAFVFRVHGTPRPQPRPRVIKGRAVSTVDAKVRLWRHAIREELRRTVSLRPARAPLSHDPLAVEMLFTFAVPASRAPGTHIGQPHTQRPDADNLAKLILDVMKDAGVYTDDSQVAELLVSKVWGHRPGVAVMVEPQAASQRQSVDYGSRQPPAWLTRS